MIIVKTHPEYANLKWVASAASKEKRRIGIFQKILIDDNKAIATNGRSLHMWSFGGSYFKIEPGLYTFKITAQQIELTKCDDASAFPNYRAVIIDRPALADLRRFRDAFYDTSAALSTVIFAVCKMGFRHSFLDISLFDKAYNIDKRGLLCDSFFIHEAQGDYDIPKVHLFSSNGHYAVIMAKRM